MNLKKSDKMIALLGVIILIVAGMAIVFYVPSDENDDDKDNDMLDTTKIFDVKSQLLSKSVQPDNTDYKAKKKLLGDGSYNGVLTINQKNVESIDIFVEYTDTKSGILFGLLLPSIGADTLTVTVSDAEGNAIDTKSIKGSGNETMNIRVGSKILTQTIEAETMGEAEQMLEQEYATCNQDYHITVTVSYGLWKMLREKLGSDSFTMDIKCNYYDYTLEEQTGEDTDGTIDDNPFGENNDNNDYMSESIKSMYASMSNGRSMI